MNKPSEFLRRGLEIMQARNLQELKGNLYSFDEQGEMTGCCSVGAYFLAFEEFAKYVTAENKPYIGYIIELTKPLCPGIAEQCDPDGSGSKDVETPFVMARMNDGHYPYPVMSIAEVAEALEELGL